MSLWISSSDFCSIYWCFLKNLTFLSSWLMISLTVNLIHGFCLDKMSLFTRTLLQRSKFLIREDFLIISCTFSMMFSDKIDCCGLVGSPIKKLNSSSYKMSFMRTSALRFVLIFCSWSKNIERRKKPLFLETKLSLISRSLLRVLTWTCFYMNCLTSFTPKRRCLLS